MSKKNEAEIRILRLSIWGLFTFSLIGIGFGLFFSSDVILFDGLFSLFFVVTSFFTLKISRFIHKNDPFNFPFGKENLEPIVVLIQYLILSFFLVVALLDAISVIWAGGSKVNLFGSITYLAVSILVLLVIVNRMSKIAKEASSPLIDSEILQWRISIKQSFYALIGYIISAILTFFSINQFIPYIDPIMVIIFVILTFATVLREVIRSSKEIIGMRSISKELTEEVEKIIVDIVKKYQINDYFIRINKVGSSLTLEVDFLVQKDFPFGKVHQQDIIREEIEDKLKVKDYDLWLTIAFTTQYKWIA